MSHRGAPDHGDVTSWCTWPRRCHIAVVAGADPGGGGGADGAWGIHGPDGVWCPRERRLAIRAVFVILAVRRSTHEARAALAPAAERRETPDPVRPGAV